LDQEPDIPFTEVHEVVVPHLGHMPIVKGDFNRLPRKAQQFIAFYADYLSPRCVYICDGSAEEVNEIKHKLMERGALERLEKMDNCYVICTDPADVARVESKTFIVTRDKHQTVPHSEAGAKGGMGLWMDPDQAKKEMDERFQNCMAGRTMYVIPFSMGPIGSPLSKIGIELTDSNYVVLCMQMMTRMSPKVWEALGDDDFVKCIHSMGCPRPWRKKVVNHWPCNPEKVMLLHFPDERKVKSYGSGYGGNSLLGKKCFALRIASNIAHDEGWMAEHMLIMGITNPKGEEFYIAAAFPSACGKTNMAMLNPPDSMPGWKIQCVGDDIAWMKFNEKGELRGINPEYGFFGVCPGTNWKTNYNAMACCQKNTIFTNTARTVDGKVFWEGLEDELADDTEVITWLGEKWKKGMPGKTAHPNSRFTTPASQCPIIHPRWEDPQGVPISALVFGGRRPEGVPLVFESFTWQHGVMIGAAVKSEATSAAEFKGKTIMHDPMAMRPFMGYNFGHYLQHWLNMEKPGRKMPKIFHVNWFRTNKEGKFLWPGFGDNVRVLDWMCKRVKGDDIADKTAVGYVPKKGSINLSGIEDKVHWDELFSLPKDYWVEDIAETRKFLEVEVGKDLPPVIEQELVEQEKRIKGM